MVQLIPKASIIDENKIETIDSIYGLILFLFAFFNVQIYFLSPLIFIYKYEKKQIELKEFPFIQVFFNFLNCFAHVLYAAKGYGALETLINNFVGLLISLGVYIRMWIALYKRGLKSIWFYLFVVTNIIFQCCFKAFTTKQPDTLSLLSLTLNILMYLSTNQNIILAIRSGDASKLPFISAIFGLIASIFWILWYSYGVAGKTVDSKAFSRKEVNNFANAISIFCLIIPITLYLLLRKNKKSEKDENNLNIQGKE